MRLQMAKPWNAIIAANEAVADSYMRAFGLSKEMWEVIRHDASTAGKRFDRVVVIRPHWQQYGDQEMAQFERQVKEKWPTLVKFEGSYHVI